MAQPSPEFVARLERDVADTVGVEHQRRVRVLADWLAEYASSMPDTALADQVQQEIHDLHVDTTWPACPRHPTHPLWYERGAWWCTGDRVAICPVGELASVWRR